ncbi:MAG: hypothetical protein HOH38_11950 [Nitrospinaceae bacterium]|nr:hypothetical protein [Nitrospinaceae bacterium]
MKYGLSKICITFGLLAVLFLHHTVKTVEAHPSHHSHIHADAGLHSSHSMGPFGTDHKAMKSGLKRFYCPIHQHFMMIPCSHKHSSMHKKAYLVGPDCHGHSQAPILLPQIGGDQPFADHPANIQDMNPGIPLPHSSIGYKSKFSFKLKHPPKFL